MRQRYPWLIPLLIVVLVVGLTVPMAYYILQAAYDRDITQNAQTLALRIRADLAQAAMDSDARGNRVLDTLRSELAADQTIQYAAFYDLTTDPPGQLWVTRRDPAATTPILAPDQIRSFAHPNMTRTQDAEHVKIAIPFIRQGQVVALTYMEFSTAALRADFWNKEGPLLWRVVGFAVAATFFLIILALAAYRWRLQLTRSHTRATLAQQGLLAERGLTAAVLAHEIRNPLAALRFQLHSLRKTPDPDRVTQTAETIDTELLRIQQLVTDYLEREKAATLHTQPVDLYQACLDIQTLLHELLRSTGTQLILQPPTDKVLAMCDPHALRQVLMNLVLNAHQALGRLGTITLRVHRGEMAELEISDTGPGLPNIIRENLFKPFHTTKPAGTGLGLALVKRFADNFGGNVTVETSEKGTTFKLSLPLTM